MFPIVYIRPDIVFTTVKLAQFMDKPKYEHAQCIKTLIYYLRSTIDLRIRYGPYSESANQVIYYSDVDYS